MSDFDPEGCLRRYFAMAQERHDLFVNPPGDIYEILLARERIEQAQAETARRRRHEGLPSDDARVGVLAADPYMTIMRDAVRFPDGSLGLYNRILSPPGAAILPLLDTRIVLIHRFRHGTRTWHLEAPRGAFNGEGDEVADARRELVEEIGASPTELIDLGIVHSTTGCIDEYHRLFLARIESIGAPDKHEAITSIRTLPVAEAGQLIASGEITDGPTLALFLRARLLGYL